MTSPDLCPACGGAVHGWVCQACGRLAAPDTAVWSSKEPDPAPRLTAPPPRAARGVLALRRACITALVLCVANTFSLVPLVWLLGEPSPNLAGHLWLLACLGGNLFLAVSVHRLQATLGSPRPWLWAALALVPWLNLVVGAVAVSSSREFLADLHVDVAPRPGSLSDILGRFGQGVLGHFTLGFAPRHWSVGVLALAATLAIVYLGFFAPRPPPDVEPIEEETPVAIPEHYLPHAKNRTDLTDGAPMAIMLSLRALDESQRPVRGASVEVWHPAPDGGYSGDSRFRGVARTDDQGTVTFRLSRPGHRRIHALVRHPERQDWAGTLNLPEGAGTVTLREARVFVQTHDGETQLPFWSVQLLMTLRPVP